MPPAVVHAELEGVLAHHLGVVGDELIDVVPGDAAPAAGAELAHGGDVGNRPEQHIALVHFDAALVEKLFPGDPPVERTARIAGIVVAEFYFQHGGRIENVVPARRQISDIKTVLAE